MFALVLGSDMFSPVSCTSIQMLLLTTPHEVRPDHPLYRSVFTVAVASDKSCDFVWLSRLPKFKAEHPNLSFIMRCKGDHCCTSGHDDFNFGFECVRVIPDTGAEQVIEVQVLEDSGFAGTTWSRYRATHSDITPIALRRVGGMDPDILVYALSCSLAVYGIGRLLRKIANKGAESQSTVGDRLARWRRGRCHPDLVGE
jgi:hypothetical protein